MICIKKNCGKELKIIGQLPPLDLPVQLPSHIELLVRSGEIKIKESDKIELKLGHRKVYGCYRCNYKLVEGQVIPPIIR